MGNDDSEYSALIRQVMHSRRTIAGFKVTMNTLTDVAVARLPAEVLALIFVHYAAMSQDYLRLPRRYERTEFYQNILSLTRVCHRWREVMLNTSSLWACIPISGKTEKEVLLQEFARRSRRAPLELYATVSSERGAAAFRSFFHEFHRLDILRLEVDPDELHTLKDCFPCSAPRLRSLHCYMDLYHRPQAAHTIPFFFSSCTVSMLEELEIGGFHFDWKRMVLPPNLVHLVVTGPKFTCSWTFAEIANALAHLRVLRYLDLDGVSPWHLDPDYMLSNPPSPIDLPSLQFLALHSYALPCAYMLEHFTLPPNTRIKLSECRSAREDTISLLVCPYLKKLGARIVEDGQDPIDMFQFDKYQMRFWKRDPQAPSTSKLTRPHFTTDVAGIDGGHGEMDSALSLRMLCAHFPLRAVTTFKLDLGTFNLEQTADWQLVMKLLQNVQVLELNISYSDSPQLTLPPFLTMSSGSNGENTCVFPVLTYLHLNGLRTRVYTSMMEQKDKFNIQDLREALMYRTQHGCVGLENISLKDCSGASQADVDVLKEVATVVHWDEGDKSRRTSYATLSSSKSGDGNANAHVSTPDPNRNTLQEQVVQQVYAIAALKVRINEVSSHAPVGRLPESILIMIFHHYIELKTDTSSYPFRTFLQSGWPCQVLAVCHRWREVAMKTPRLWSTIYVGPRSKLLRLNTFLSLSKQESLRVHASLRECNEGQIQLLQSVLQELHRISEFHLSNAYNDLCSTLVFRCQAPAQAPALQRLHLDLNTFPLLCNSSEEPTDTSITSLVNLPSLETLIVIARSLTWSKITLTTSLTSLSVRGVDTDKVRSLSSIVCVLRGLPSLRHLSLEGCFPPSHVSGGPSPADSVPLYQLQRLRLAGPLSTCAYLLSSLSISSSTRLLLEPEADYPNLSEITSILIPPILASLRLDASTHFQELQISSNTIELFQNVRDGGPLHSFTEFDADIFIRLPRARQWNTSFIESFPIQDVTTLTVSYLSSTLSNSRSLFKQLDKLTTLRFTASSEDVGLSSVINILSTQMDDPNVQSQDSQRHVAMPLLKHIFLDRVIFPAGNMWGQSNRGDRIMGLRRTLEFREQLGSPVETLSVRRCLHVGEDDVASLKSVVSVEWDGLSRDRTYW
ncbi:hypothetical protein EIP91_009324 [Steccherinum ochraceum]|uniref:F-box domain-containing protein n=1 Tax=Steccherinum ochraceum TaxID=92696 RepID=A0A4R0RZX3_9APHY|nr:hypothetical protein EIP91_009324 [Steccherinum ochraceum]